MFGTGERELAVGRILGNGGARTDGGARADAHRCHQHAARPDEGAVADDGRPLVHAVIIAGDGAGADVHRGPHVGVAHVAQVVHLAADSDLGILDFHKVSHMGIAPHRRVGPQAGKGADAAVIPHQCLFDDAIGVDLRIGADARIANQAIRPHRDAGPQVHVADQHGAHVDEDVAFHGDGAAHIHSQRIGQRGAGDHQLLGAQQPQPGFDLCELEAIVDAQHLHRARDRYGLNRIRALDGGGHHIRQIIFALHVGRSKPQQPVAQPSGRRGHETRVGLADPSCARTIRP